MALAMLWKGIILRLLNRLYTQLQTDMHQVKIFKGLESNLPALEKEMNAWLAESGVKVTQIFGNLASAGGDRNEQNSLAAYPYVASDVLLVVVYEVNKPV